jgi:hypothetical protein
MTLDGDALWPVSVLAAHRESLGLLCLVVLSLLVLSHQFYPGLVERHSPVHAPSVDQCKTESVHPSPTSIGLSVDTASEGPAGTDRDDDGLADATERELGTSQVVADTDGDGFLDGVEHRASRSSSGPFETLDPLRKNVYVEVDSPTGVDGLSETGRQRLTNAYADAPVVNPDGSTGISLRLVADETDPCVPTSQSPTDYYRHYKQDQFDGAGYGFYHILVVEDIDGDWPSDSIRGAAKQQTNGAIVRHQTGVQTGITAMHELGHLQGIGSGRYKGVDGARMPIGRYDSVLNYNHDSTRYVFSAGEPFDDWEYIARHQATPRTDAIEQRVIPWTDRRVR